MKKCALWICLFMLGTCCGWAASLKRLRVGSTGDYPPLTVYDARTNHFSGTAIQLIKNFAKDNGYFIQFVKTTWPHLSADLAAKRFDVAVGGISITPTRQKQFLFSIPILTFGKVALVRCGEQAKFSTLHQIDQAGVVVVENRGGTNQVFAEQHIRHAKLVIVDNNRLPFSYLKSHQADVMFTDSIEAVYRQSLHTGLCAVHPDTPYTHAEKAFMFSDSQRALRDQFNRWFLQRKQARHGSMLVPV